MTAPDVEALVDEKRRQREEAHRQRQQRRAVDRAEHRKARTYGLGQRHAHELRRSRAGDTTSKETNMPSMTIKQLGDRIRQDLKRAQQTGVLPGDVGEYGQVRFDVRASNPKAGPKVDVTVSGIEPLISGYPELTAEAVERWMDTRGPALLATVDRIRNGYNPPIPVYRGEAKFGSIILSARVSKVATLTN